MGAEQKTKQKGRSGLGTSPGSYDLELLGTQKASTATGPPYVSVEPAAQVPG